MFPRVPISGMSGSSFDQVQQFFPPASIQAPVNYMHASLSSLSLLPGFQADPNLRVALENGPLWDSFNKHTTEMIITKTGRRMFPVVKVNVSGLEKSTRYYVILDMVPVDDCRYKYHSSAWTNSGKGDPHFHGRYYTHPDSPATGAQWMRQAISFSKVKLTNNNFDQNGQIILNSMHKYQPRIHIIRSDDLVAFNYTAFNTCIFPETIFVAVTAYQNEQITKLKIDNNPFAKGFRDLRDCKRVEERWSGKRSQESPSTENEEPVKTKFSKDNLEDDRSVSPLPDSTCSPSLMANYQGTIPFCPSHISSAWQQHYAQNYMNYLYPQAASWMFQRFPGAGSFPSVLPFNLTGTSLSNDRSAPSF